MPDEHFGTNGSFLADWGARRAEAEAAARGLVEAAATAARGGKAHLAHLAEEAARIFSCDGIHSVADAVVAAGGRFSVPSVLDLAHGAMATGRATFGTSKDVPVRLVGCPVFFRTGEDAKRWAENGGGKLRALPRRGADVHSSRLVREVWMANPGPPGVSRHPLPSLASPWGVGRLDVDLRRVLEAAVAANAPGAKSPKSSLVALARLLHKADTGTCHDYDTHELGHPFAFGGIALALDVSLDGGDTPLPPISADLSRRLPGDPAVMLGSAGPYVQARAELVARLLLARCRMSAGLEAWPEGLAEGDVLHLAEYGKSLRLALATSEGRVVHRRMTFPGGIGASLLDALEAMTHRLVVHPSPDRLPGPKTPGQADPKDARPEEVSADLVREGWARAEVADILCRAFDAPGQATGLMGTRPLSDFGHLRLEWARADNAVPVPASVEGALRAALRCVLPDAMENRDEALFDKERAEQITASWADALLRIPMADFVVRPEWRLSLSPWNRDPGGGLCGRMGGKGEFRTTTLAGGRDLRLAEWLADNNPACGVIARRFEADLTVDGEKVAAMAGGLLRLRRRGAVPSARGFLAALDAADDGFTAIAARMLQVDPDPASWFSRGSVVWITDVGVLPEHRRKGHGLAMCTEILRLLSARWGRCGTLVADVLAPGLMFVPGPGAPSDLRMLHARIAAAARRLLSDPRLVEGGLGRGAKAVVFDMGSPMSRIEAAMLMGSVVLDGSGE